MNYWLSAVGLRHSTYIYVDTKYHLSKHIFESEGLSVRELSSVVCAVGDKSSYSIVMCEVPNKDRKAFESAMWVLRRQIILMGYLDYSEFCKQARKNWD